MIRVDPATSLSPMCSECHYATQRDSSKLHNMVINDDRGCAQRMAGWLAARRSRQVCIKGPKGLVPRRGTALNKVHGSRGGPSRADGVVQW